MTDRSGDNDVRHGMAAHEWRLRCDLAAAHQLIDLYGMSDLGATHLSARVPGGEDHFLLAPYGRLFDQVTASSLVKVDVDGSVINEGGGPINPAGFVIHSAIHMARRDVTCAMHTHTRANNAVATTTEGLLPLTQAACTMLPFVRYHDFEGAALDIDERERIIRDAGDGCVILLRNHGALTLGRTIAEAWGYMFRIETACRYQVDILSCVAAGQTLNQLAPDTIERTMDQARQYMSPGAPTSPGTIEWPFLLAKLERERGSTYRT